MQRSWHLEWRKHTDFHLKIVISQVHRARDTMTAIWRVLSLNRSEEPPGNLRYWEDTVHVVKERMTVYKQKMTENGENRTQPASAGQWLNLTPAITKITKTEKKSREIKRLSQTPFCSISRITASTKSKYNWLCWWNWSNDNDSQYWLGEPVNVLCLNVLYLLMMALIMRVVLHVHWYLYTDYLFECKNTSLDFSLNNHLLTKTSVIDYTHSDSLITLINPSLISLLAASVSIILHVI